MTPIVLRDEARDELDEAILFLERWQTGSGIDLLVQVQAVLDQIGQHPEMYRIVRKDIRKARVHPTPYSVFYKITPRWIDVFSIFHGSRDPAIWQDRG